MSAATTQREIVPTCDRCGADMTPMQTTWFCNPCESGRGSTYVGPHDDARMLAWLMGFELGAEELCWAPELDAFAVSKIPASTMWQGGALRGLSLVVGAEIREFDCDCIADAFVYAVKRRV